MLFDLRSRGRRRVIQVVYGFLALLIGGGLVFFGIGTGGNGTGILSQLAQQGNGSATGVKIDETAMEKARRAVNADPTSAKAWDRYALTLFQLADTNYITTSSSQGFTSAGAKELAVLKSAWNHYLSLNPAKPDSSLAADVAFAFGSSGIGEYPVAETAQEVVAEANPKSYTQYAELAAYAYLAHQTDQATLAEAKALALAPKAQRATIQSQLADIAKEASGSTGTSGATGSSGTSG